MAYKVENKRANNRRMMNNAGEYILFNWKLKGIYCKIEHFQSHWAIETQRTWKIRSLSFIDCTLNFVSKKDRIDLRPVSPTINYTPQSEIGHREAAYSTKRRKLRNAFPISITMLVEGRSDFSAWNDMADYFLREFNSEQKRFRY